MGELRSEKYGIMDQVMALYDLLPDDIKEPPLHCANLHDWMKTVRPAMQESLVKAGIHLSEIETAIFDLNLHTKYLEQVQERKKI